MALEFRVEKCTYRVQRPMDAFTQFDLIAKVSPLLASGFGEFVPFFIAMRKEGIAKIGDIPMDRMAKLVGPIARELAKMPTEDRHFVLASCLSICDRKQDGPTFWAPVWNPQAGRSMFDDINNDISVMLRIALAVFQGTFSNFFPASLSGSTGEARPPISK